MYYRHDPFGRRVVRETTVPRKLAEEIARERDLYRRELERVQRENEALRQRLVEQAQTREQEQPLPPEPRPRTLEIEEEAEEVRAVEQSELEREHAVAVKRAQELLEDLERLQRKQEDELTARARRARRETVSAYLELRDNLSRAIALARDHGSSWSDGMEALRDQFDTINERLGVERFGEIGDPFDPTIHEAIGAMHVEDLPQGSIAHIEREGFRFADDGALLRTAQVVVAR